MTGNRSTEKSKEHLLWLGAITFIIVSILIIVAFSPVGNLIVLENGELKRGSSLPQRLTYFLAPKIQGDRFWRDQYDYVKKNISREQIQPTLISEAIARLEADLDKEIRNLEKVSEENPDFWRQVAPSESGATRFERSVAIKMKRFSEEVRVLQVGLESHPVRIERLRLIEQQVLKKLGISQN